MSGGAPYSIAIEESRFDPMVLWEPHCTTFINYLRLSFQSAGMPGFGLVHQTLPDELRDLAAELQPV